MEKTDLRTEFTKETKARFNVEWVAYNDYVEWLEQRLVKSVSNSVCTCGSIAFISIEESLPERNKYVLVKTPFCKYPAAVAYWNGVDWIDTTDKCKIMNVEWWRPLNVD